MTRYRVKSGVYYKDGSSWFLAQKRGWIFWHNLYPYNRFDPSASSYFDTLEAAKAAIEKDKNYCLTRQKIVWRDNESL